jgi:hypothetical protein
VTAAPSAANRAGLEVTAASFAHFGGALIRTRLLENSAANGHRIELVRVLVRSTRIWVACRVHEVGVALKATSSHHVQRSSHRRRRDERMGGVDRPPLSGMRSRGVAEFNLGRDVCSRKTRHSPTCLTSVRHCSIVGDGLDDPSVAVLHPCGRRVEIPLLDRRWLGGHGADCGTAYRVAGLGAPLLIARMAWASPTQLAALSGNGVGRCTVP